MLVAIRQGFPNGVPRTMAYQVPSDGNRYAARQFGLSGDRPVTTTDVKVKADVIQANR